MKKFSSLYLLTALAILLIFTSCGKKKGSFTTDKETYSQRDLITVTNNTETEAKFYKWSFGGTEITGKNPTFTIPDDTPAGSFEIKLVPTNSENTVDNWKSTSKFVNIVDAELGQVTFWKRTSSSSTSGTITVLLFLTTSNYISKTVTASYSSSTLFSCGATGVGNAVFTNLKKGKYNYTATGSNFYTSGTIEILTPTGCVIEALY